MGETEEPLSHQRLQRVLHCQQQAKYSIYIWIEIERPFIHLLETLKVEAVH